MEVSAGSIWVAPSLRLKRDSPDPMVERVESELRRMLEVAPAMLKRIRSERTAGRDIGHGREIDLGAGRSGDLVTVDVVGGLREARIDIGERGEIEQGSGIGSAEDVQVVVATLENPFEERRPRVSMVMGVPSSFSVDPPERKKRESMIELRPPTTSAGFPMSTVDPPLRLNKVRSME